MGGRFIQNRPVFLFLEPQEKGELLELASGTQLTSLLAESTGFVFYLTNDQLSYLLAYNDHNVLIGTGEARYWIETLLP